MLPCRIYQCCCWGHGTGKRGKPTRKGTPQSPSWSQDSACGGSFWAKGASPPLAVSSFSSLLIYFLYLSEKGKHGFCVFSFAYCILFVCFLVFICFRSTAAHTGSSLSLPTPPLPRQCVAPGLFPNWPPLSPSCPLLSRPITLVPGKQVK